MEFFFAFFSLSLFRLIVLIFHRDLAAYHLIYSIGMHFFPSLYDQLFEQFHRNNMMDTFENICSTAPFTANDRRVIISIHSMKRIHFHFLQVTFGNPDCCNILQYLNMTDLRFPSKFSVTKLPVLFDLHSLQFELSFSFGFVSFASQTTTRVNHCKRNEE